MENSKEKNKETFAEKVVRECNENCPKALRTILDEDGVETYADKKAVSEYYAKKEAKRIADMDKPKKLTPQQQVKKEIMLAVNKKAYPRGGIELDETKHWNEDFLFDYATKYGIDKMLALDFDEAETLNGQNDNQNTKSQSIVGFGYNRDPLDNYPSPDSAIKELLKREKFEGEIWEPACGSGNIAKFLPGCIATDIRADKIYGQGNVDFFGVDRKVDSIITNPPYYLAEEFVEHAYHCTRRKVALLLKLAFLESESRYELFQRFPLKNIYVFSKRLTMTKESDTRKQSGMIAFAWFIWDKEYTGKPTIEWILATPSEDDTAVVAPWSGILVKTEDDEMMEYF